MEISKNGIDSRIWDAYGKTTEKRNILDEKLLKKIDSKYSNERT